MTSVRLSARALEREVAELNPEHPVRLQVEATLVPLLADDRSPEQNATVAEDVYGRALRALGASHPITDLARGYMTTYRRRGGLVPYDVCVAEYRTLLRDREEAEPGGRKGSIARLNLSLALRDSDNVHDVTEAITLAEYEWHTRSDDAAKTGKSNANVVPALEAYVRACVRRAQMGAPYFQGGQLDKLRSLSDDLEAAALAAYGRTHGATVQAMICRASAYLTAGDAATAVLLLDIAARHKNHLDPDQAGYLPSTQARAWAESTDPDDMLVALTLAETAVEMTGRAWGANTPAMIHANQLADTIRAKVAALPVSSHEAAQ